MNEYFHSPLLTTEPKMSEAGVGGTYTDENGEIVFTALSASLESEIDQLGLMTPAYIAAKKAVAEYEARLKMLREGVEQHATGNQALRARGNMFAADLTEPAKTRVVTDINKVVQILGASVFLKYAKFNVTDVDAVIAPERRAEVIGFKEGNRKLVITKI